MREVGQAGGAGVLSAVACRDGTDTHREKRGALRGFKGNLRLFVAEIFIYELLIGAAGTGLRMLTKTPQKKGLKSSIPIILHLIYAISSQQPHTKTIFLN